MLLACNIGAANIVYVHDILCSYCILMRRQSSASRYKLETILLRKTLAFKQKSIESQEQKSKNTASVSMPIYLCQYIKSTIIQNATAKKPQSDTTTKFLIIIQPENFPTTKRHTYSYFKIKSSHQKPGMGRCWYHTFTTQMAHEQANCVTKMCDLNNSHLPRPKGKSAQFVQPTLFIELIKCYDITFGFLYANKNFSLSSYDCFRHYSGKWCARQNPGSMVFAMQRSLNASNNFKED